MVFVDLRTIQQLHFYHSVSFIYLTIYSSELEILLVSADTILFPMSVAAVRHCFELSDLENIWFASEIEILSATGSEL